SSGRPARREADRLERAGPTLSGRLALHPHWWQGRPRSQPPRRQRPMCMASAAPDARCSGCGTRALQWETPGSHCADVASPPSCSTLTQPDTQGMAIDPYDVAICTALEADDAAGWAPAAPPIVQTSLFTYPTFDALLDAFAAEHRHRLYTRGQNPTVEILEPKAR